MESFDYEATTGELVFGSHETSKDIFIRVLEDDLAKMEEQFYVDLSAVDGYPVELMRATVRVLATERELTCWTAQQLLTTGFTLQSAARLVRVRPAHLFVCSPSRPCH